MYDWNTFIDYSIWNRISIIVMMGVCKLLSVSRAVSILTRYGVTSESLLLHSEIITLYLWISAATAAVANDWFTVLSGTQCTPHNKAQLCQFQLFHKVWEYRLTQIADNLPRYQQT